MKEMPEKIYVYIPDDDTVGTASLQKGFPHQFVTEEYTSTDAFIEKACEFIETYPHLFMGVLRSEVIEDFKKYMDE